MFELLTLSRIFLISKSCTSNKSICMELTLMPQRYLYTTQGARKGNPLPSCAGDIAMSWPIRSNFLDCK